jgi:hypothetical protein
VTAVVGELRWSEKESGDRLVGEAVMAGARLFESQALFDVPAGDPIYDDWPVGPTQAVSIPGIAGVTVDLSRFDDFIEADAGSAGEPA